MNSGDKVICIKDLFINEFSTCTILTKGNLYEIEDVYNKTFWIMTNDRLRVINNDIFSKYFITLPEWREQQMRSILDE
jgi:hypothetical protein